jgi:predicted membrane-bound spermidine synthase
MSRDRADAVPASDLRTLRTTRLVFFLSGFSSLIYQVVWQRLLTLHCGVGAVSNAVIVGVFLAGLGLGGLIGGWLAERQRRLLRTYLVVELAIGAFGLGSLPLLSVIGRHTAGSDLVVSGVWTFLFLGIPTLLMGTTLPLLTKALNRQLRHFLRTLSSLYFINTIGAAAGTVAASYLFISLLGLDGAVWIAAAINLAIAVLVTAASRRADAVFPERSPVPGATVGVASQSLGRLAFPVVVVTGFLGIGYEMAWLRVVGVLVKDTPYAFASTLFVYLLGIALGSHVLERAVSRGRALRPLDLFLSLQAATAVVVALSFIGLTAFARTGIVSRLLVATWASDPLPFPLPPSSLPSTIEAAYRFVPYTATFLWPLALVLAPTLLIGASFPLVSSLALADPAREGRAVGHVWFWSVVGNVLGAVVTTFVLLPLAGTERTLLCFILVGLAAFLARAAVRGPAIRRLGFIGAFGALAAAAVLLFPARGEIYRAIHPAPAPAQSVLFEEGTDGICAIYRNQAGIRVYINGSEHGVRPSSTYLSWLYETVRHTPSVRSVLVIGYGSGGFVDAILGIEGVEAVTAVELSPTLLKNLRKLPEYSSGLGDRRVRLVVDDGRRFLLRSAQRFDLILMDPIRSTSSYANNLHSREFFELLRAHLAPEGVLLLAGVREWHVLPRTLAAVFDHVRAYGYYLLASPSPLRPDGPFAHALLASIPEPLRGAVLRDAGGDYRGDRQHILAISAGYPVNRELEPWTEYYLGLRMREVWGSASAPASQSTRPATNR